MTLAITGPWAETQTSETPQAQISLWPWVASRPLPLTHSSLPSLLQICLYPKDMNHSVSLTPHHTLLTMTEPVHADLFQIQSQVLTFRHISSIDFPSYILPSFFTVVVGTELTAPHTFSHLAPAPYFFVSIHCCNRPLVRPSCPAARNLNNHTETVFIKSLLDPLALASCWLTLTS